MIITGELSGETHAAHLIGAIRALSPFPFEFSGIGSTRLAEAGALVIHDYRDISIVGISEVFSKLLHIRRAYVTIKKHLADERPDILILVDFPDFNLLVARAAKRLSIPVVYFIPPQLWAWRQGRIDQIKANADLVLSILPFEEEFFRKRGVEATYVGHPYMEIVRPALEREQFYANNEIDPSAPVICIMPGSRRGEVERHVPVLTEVLGHLDRELGRYTALVPVAASLKTEYLLPLAEGRQNVRFIEGLPHDCLAYSGTAIVKSGSSTLEAAILGCPSVVIYRMSAFSYLVGRLVAKTKYISLPNLIAGRAVFPEFIQSLKPERIAKAAISMLNNDGPPVREELEQIRRKLATSDPQPYRTAARAILRFLEHTHGPLRKTA